MKNNSPIIFLHGVLLISLTLFSSLSRAQSSEISSVVVSLNGSTVRKKMAVSLKPGINSFSLEGLPRYLKANSFQIQLSDSDRLVSINEFSDSIINPKKTALLDRISDSLQFMDSKLQALRFENEAILIEKKLLTSNIERIGHGGVTALELQTTIPFYRQQLKSIHEALLRSDQEIAQLGIRKIKLGEMAEKTSLQKATPSNTIVITLDSKTAKKETLEFSYVVENAYWEPLYDIKSQGPGFPIRFTYKARIVNKSGEDWLKIPLTLTTTESQSSMKKPNLPVWTLTYNRTQYGTEGGLAEYQMRRDNSGYKDDKQEITVSSNQSEFVLPGLRTVVSGNKAEVFEINQTTFPALYKYYCVPKVDPKVYLVGKITGWESLNLVQGSANVYLDNVFMGTSEVDIQSANDTLEFFLGADKNIIVNRAKMKSEGAKATIGLNRTLNLMYKISIRNNRATTVQLELVDQLPVAQESDIEVNINSISGADHDLPSGKLVWNLDVPPKDTKSILLDFQVKYPRQKSVNVRAHGRQSPPKFR